MINIGHGCKKKRVSKGRVYNNQFYRRYNRRQKRFVLSKEQFLQNLKISKNSKILKGTVQKPHYKNIEIFIEDLMKESIELMFKIMKFKHRR